MTLEELAAAMETAREALRADTNPETIAVYKAAVAAFETARTQAVEASEVAASDGDVTIQPETLAASAEAQQ